MKSVALKAYPRNLTRRSGVRKLRAQDRVPAVIYGRKIQARNLELELKELEDVIHGSASENILVDLAVVGEDDGKRLALVQEVQHHALSGDVLHVDFHEVGENEPVTVTVPVEAIGEAEGVKTGGGILEHVLFKLKVRALPKDLPEIVRVDVSHLKMGEAIHIGEIQAPPGVAILGNKNISVFAVAAPLTEAQEAEAEAAAAAAAGEPEMIREKKDEEGAEAGPEKPGEKKEKGEKPEKPEKSPEKAEKGAEKAAKPEKKK
jgi:large subunit ribosomal protein L25